MVSKWFCLLGLVSYGLLVALGLRREYCDGKEESLTHDCSDIQSYNRINSCLWSFEV
mgnify:CR=1 FL=1